MWTDVMQFVTDIRASYGTGGWAAALGTAFFGVVTVYRLPLVQKLIAKVAGLHPKLGFLYDLIWARWSTVTKVLVVTVPLGLAAFFTTFATGGTIWASFGALVAALVTAMGSRQMFKMLGEKPVKSVLQKISDNDMRKTALKTEMPQPKVSDDSDPKPPA